VFLSLLCRCFNDFLNLCSAVPIDQDNVYVVHMDYSPLLAGFSVTLNDGRAAFLSANNLKFDPNVSIVRLNY
jgi:hypothetical protein